MGNVCGRNGIQKFAQGGIVHSPTIFPFKNGIGLNGRGWARSGTCRLNVPRQGRLGVEVVLEEEVILLT